jgi:hypothetical protein
MNHRAPLKYLLVASVILLALLIGAYLLRTTLITRSVNILLAGADVRVLQLGTLRLGWSDLYVDQLVLGVGPGDARQTLQEVSLGYSVLDLQPRSLAAERVILTLPQQQAEADSNESPVLLFELLDMLFALPLQSMTVGRLEVAGLSHPLFEQPLAVNASVSERSISLQGRDHNKEILLDLQRAEPNTFSVDATLFKDGEAVIHLVLSLDKQQDTLFLEGEGELQVSTAFAMLRPALPELIILSEAAGQVFYQFSGELEDDLLQWEAARGTIQLMPTTPLRAKLSNQALSASLELVVASPAHISLQPGTSQSPGLSLTLDAASLQFSEANHSVLGNVDLSGLECSVFSALSCHGGLIVTMNALHLYVPIESAAALVDPQLNISAQFSLEDSVLSAKILAGQWLRAGSVVQDGLVFSGPALIGDSQGNFNFDITSGVMNLDVAALRLLVPRAELPDMNLATVLQLQKLILSGDGGSAFDASFHISSKALNIQVPQLWLPALGFEAEVVVTERALSLDGSVRGGGQQPLLQVEAGYNLPQQRGRARFYTKGLDFNADEKRLSKHFSSWPFEWDVLAGSVVLDSTVLWQVVGSQFELVATIKQDMNGIAGVYQDLGIVGLAADIALQFQSPDRLKTTQAANISVDSVDVGVTIEAIEARIQFDSEDQSVTLDSLQAKLFGGRVWVEEAVYHADQPHNKLFVGVDGIQLNQLLQHAGYDAVQATGSISGLLPLDVNSAGATMKRGMLAAKAPGGVFRYKAEVTTDIDSTVAPVLAALENYHYDVFQLEADYLDDGELQLAMVFRGSNPQVQQGRPIHLNLNVTDNIPKLLKSLQSGRRIAETVEKKLGGG